MRLLPRAAALLFVVVGLTTTMASAQLTTVDGFSWDRADVRLRPSLDLTARVSYTTFGDALGSETDVVMTMPVVTDTAAAMALQAQNQSLRFTAKVGGKYQWLLSYDGIDQSADTVRATSGLRGFDLTAGGFQNQFVFDAFNWGNSVNTSIFVLSDTSEISQAEVVIAPGIDTLGYTVPFDSFSPVVNGADFEKVNAIIIIVGSGGGVEGPVDLRLMNFGTDVFFQPTVAGDTVLYDQRNGALGGQWFTNQFPSGDPFSAEAADDFTVSAGLNWKVNGLTVEGSYIAGPGPNPTANLYIVDDTPGLSSNDTLGAYPNLPVTSWNPFVFSLPDTGLGLSEGTYWLTLTLNAPPGTEGFFRGSPTPYGNAALWWNPLNGFGFGCTSFTPLNNCFGNDQSFLFSISGESDKPRADIAVSITPDSASSDRLVVVGDTINYTIRVANVGEVASPSTEVGFTLQRSLVLSVMESQGTCTNIYLSPGLTSYTCQLGALAPGDSATIHVESIASRHKKVSAGVVFKPNEFPDEVASNNRAGFDAFAEHSLTAEKTASGTEFLVGSEITFEVTIRNISTETVDGVYVEDVFVERAYEHLSNTADCEEYIIENEVQGFVVPLTGLKCEFGSLAPGEERTFEIMVEATEASGHWSNSVDLFSSRGLEDRAAVSPELKGELAYAALIFRYGAIDPRLFEKSALNAVDVYLNETLLADDLGQLEATAFKTVSVTSYPSRLYLVPADAPDRMSAFDTLDVALGGVGPGTGAALLLGPDEAGQNSVIVIPQASVKSDDPNGATFSFVHAAASAPTVTPAIMGDEITPVLLESVAFGERTEFYPWETLPATFNLHISPVGDAAAEEVYKVDLTTPGLSYLLVLAPDTALGKLEFTSLYVVDSEGGTATSAIVTSAEPSDEIPAEYALYANYPNPFNPETSISYALPEPGSVRIEIFDVSGRRVSTLFDGMQVAGTHSVTWRGQSDTGMPIASGVYIYRMTSGSFVASKTMLLIK